MAPAQSKSARDDDKPTGETQQELAARQAAAAAASGAPLKSVTGRQPELQSNRARAADGAYNSWSVDVDHGVTQADLERTSFWVHHAKTFRPNDEVRAVCVDGSWVAWMIVDAVGPKDVKLTVLQFLNRDSIAPDAFEVPSGYSIDWGGSIAKWRARRGPDVIKEGFEQRSHAQTWLGNHLASLAR